MDAFDPGIEIKDIIICGLCNKEIKYDNILGYNCNECGLPIKIKKGVK